MNYYTEDTTESIMLDNMLATIHPPDDRQFYWQGPSTFDSEHLHALDPYMNEIASHQQYYNPLILSPLHQDGPSLFYDAAELIPPPPCFTKMADIYCEPSTSIRMRSSPLPFGEHYPRTCDSFLAPLSQNQEIPPKICAPPLFPNMELRCEPSSNACLQNPLQRFLNFNSPEAMDELLACTAEQVDLPYSTTQCKE